MIAPVDLPEYLLTHRLIDPDILLDGHFRITDASRRNQNSAVRADGWDGLFVKQTLPDDGSASLAHEAAVYELLSALPGRLPALLPACRGYDRSHGLLLLDLVEEAETLLAHHSRTHRFPTSLADRLGAALGALHAQAFGPAERYPEQFRGRVPWALGLDVPGTAVLCEASVGGLQLIRILQSVPELRAQLAELRAEWHVDAFIHHDLKWDNCLVMRSPRTSRGTQLRLIDWEFADLGDACWDAGSVLGNYLSFWLASVPVAGREPPDRYLELSRYPLERMQPSIRAFWSRYVTARRWDSVVARSALLRCVRYAGVRLIQSAYERNQQTVRLDGSSICQLQLAHNLIGRPDEAATHLLGIADLTAPR